MRGLSHASCSHDNLPKHPSKLTGRVGGMISGGWAPESERS